MTSDPTPTWLEIHVRDEDLRGPGRSLPLLRATLDRTARAAEERGARLSFRYGERAAADRTSIELARDLVRRGHEVGACAPGSGLEQVVASLRKAGVAPEVAAPGLGHGGRGGRPPLLRQVATLGVGVACDHGLERAWAYEGLLARREAGLLVLAPTVRRAQWLTGGRPVAHAFERLTPLHRAAAGHGADWFGAVLTAGDLLEAGTGQPAPDVIEAMAAWVDRSTVTVGTVAARCGARPVSGPPRPISDRKAALAGLAGGVVDAARRTWPDRLRRPRLDAEALPDDGDAVEVDDRRITVRRVGPASPGAAIACSISGPAGGRAADLAFLGLVPDDLVREGWAVWLFDRSSAGDTRPRPELGDVPGSPEHVADWRAVLDRARGEGVPVVALTWSAGIVPVLLAASAGDRPDALVDAEAPVDRWSLFHPRGKGPVDLDRWQDAHWEGIEAIRLLGDLRRPYARLQGTHDHVHGPMTIHAERMVRRAREVGTPAIETVSIDGRLHEGPDAVLEGIRWAVAQAGG